MHYNGPIVRPYTDADSLIIEVTVGCTHNKCIFCNFYKGIDFQIATIEQIEMDLKEASRLVPRDIKNVWASGGNPYALSVEKLTTIAKLIRKYFPQAIISMYARVDDLCRKTVEDMMHLKDLGIADIVVGIENGYDPALSYVNKGYRSADILEGCKRLEKAGVDYRIIYLGGLSGAGKGDLAAVASAKLLNRLHPYYMFMTTVAILPGTEIHVSAQNGEFEEATELERIKEFRMLIGELRNDMIIDSRSVANMVPFVAQIPRDKEKILHLLDKMIQDFSDKDEEAMHGRRSELLSV
jgi:Fe-S oxidoreductase